MYPGQVCILVDDIVFKEVVSHDTRTGLSKAKSTVKDALLSILTSYNTVILKLPSGHKHGVSVVEQQKRTIRHALN